MSFLDRIENAFDDQGREFKPGAAAISGPDVVFGTDPSEWSPAEYGSYLATSNAVYTCATIRADLLKSVPLRAYRLKKESGRGRRAMGGDSKREAVESGPLVDLLTKVNDFWTFRRLLTMSSLSLDLWGKFYWFLERGETGRGTPKEIWWARPDRVRVVPDSKRYIKGYLYEPMDGGKPIPFSVDETIAVRYPNPLDEFDGLSPLAAARLAADLATAAGKANRGLFDQGLMIGGVIMPKGEEKTFSPQQQDDLERKFDRRFRGVDKAHRWALLATEVQLMGASQIGFSPKDAEFMGTLKWSLEEVCRAYKIPLDFVGGDRTYSNVEAAEKAIWIRAIKPNAEFIADELTEQLIPKIGGADLLEFDLSGVEVLQEAEGAQWTRAKEQMGSGALTINEWRAEKGMDPVAWGDVYWAPFSLVPVDSADTAPAPAPDTAGQESFGGRSRSRQIEYDSDVHRVMFRKIERHRSIWERRVSETTIGLFERLRDSVIDTLKAPRSAKKRDAGGVSLNPFDLAKWIRAFREAIRPVLREMVLDAGQSALDDIGVEIMFNIEHSAAIQFIEKRAQRFAEAVPETTWQNLQASLTEGISAGEGIPELEERVLEVMADRIKSTPETIARTEVVGGMNGGSLLGYEQSGVVEGKGWLAALDARTRDSHIEAHRRYSESPIGLNEDFEIGAGFGPAPGEIGLAEEDINCRCAIYPVVMERSVGKGSNGRVEEAVLKGILERLEVLP